MKSHGNPLRLLDEKVLGDIVKSLEMRWGLTLVSFLDSESRDRMRVLQEDISALCHEDGKQDVRRARRYIEFYGADQFHCTHFTLTRSNPEGPLSAVDLVKAGQDLRELVTVIAEIAAETKPLKAELNRLTMKPAEFGIIALGECVGDESVRGRRALISKLASTLPGLFNVTPRAWDDGSKAHSVHCAVGYVKREMPTTYDRFVTEVCTRDVRRIPLEFSAVTLVHHRRRSLAPPHEGSVTFRLGEEIAMNSDDLVGKLNLQ